MAVTSQFILVAHYYKSTNQNLTQSEQNILRKSRSINFVFNEVHKISCIKCGLLTKLKLTVYESSLCLNVI
jgi:hypothetical protein